MDIQAEKRFGEIIAALTRKENLSREQAKEALSTILNNQTTPMQQGAFLAALVAKGETTDEVSACWEAIFDIDTNRVELPDDLNVVENCGTGMDTFKTFNISTAASIVAAAAGIPMARHGARAITSVCGTVDIAEALGVDVECPVSVVADSIVRSNVGLFNGMSRETHPVALGRILSQIFFGSTLNISASLANPALPKTAVRGVYRKGLLLPVLQVMQSIGYKRAITVYGTIDNTDWGMDEASVCGQTFIAELMIDGTMKSFSHRPDDFGLTVRTADEIAPFKEIGRESIEFLKVIKNCSTDARKEATALNAALILYVSGKVSSIEDGVKRSIEILEQGRAFETLKRWVLTQNREPLKGLDRLSQLNKQISVS